MALLDTILGESAAEAEIENRLAFIPQSSLDAIGEARLKELFCQVQDVLRTAIACHLNLAQLPDSCLLPHRHRDGTCQRAGTPLKIKKVGGRTTYCCPKHQRQQISGPSSRNFQLDQNYLLTPESLSSGFPLVEPSSALPLFPRPEGPRASPSAFCLNCASSSKTGASHERRTCSSRSCPACRSARSKCRGL
jgi:hypothetical protein